MEVCFLCTFLMVCSVFDIKGWKVPNWLFVSGLAAETLYKFIGSGLSAVWTFLVSFIFIQLMLGAFWRFGFFGAADIKILGIVCAYVGWRELPKLISCILVFGAAVSLCRIFKNKKLIFRIINIKKYIYKCVFAGKLLNYRELFCESETGKIPFIPIIMAGYLLYWVVKGYLK